MSHFQISVDALHYKPELDISALTTQDLRNIETIYKGLVENAPLRYKDRQNGFGYINLGNHPIKLVFYQVSEDMYRMVDGLRLDDLTVSVFFRGEGDAPVAVAPLFVQTMQDYMRLANIDAEVFAATLKQYPVTEVSSAYVNGKHAQQPCAETRTWPLRSERHLAKRREWRSAHG